jgi:WD40 repeat protein
MSMSECEQHCRALEDLLTDIFFLEAKTEAGLVFELAVDLAQGAEALPAGRPQSRVLRLLEEALRRDIHFIARHPTTLFQCMWNLCWWYDCPDAVAHFEEPGSDSSQAQAELGVHQLVEGWLKSKLCRCPGFLWIRSLRPPRDGLGSAVNILFNNVRLVAMAPDGKCVATHSPGASSDPQEKVVRPLFAPREQDSTKISSQFQLWTTETGKSVDWYPRELANGKLFAFCQKSHRIVILFSSGQMQVWDLKSRAMVHELSVGEIGDLLMTANEDGGWVATLEGHSRIRIWNSASGQETAEWICPSRFVYDFAFSADGAELATSEKDGVVVIWNVRSGRERVRLVGHRGDVRSVAFSSDGEQILSGGDDGTVRTWSRKTGLQTHCLVGHKGTVFSAAFSQDSRRVVSGGADETVRVWDVSNGTELGRMSGHGRQVLNVAFLPDGRTLSFGFDHTIRTWRPGRADAGRRLRNPHFPDWISTCTFSCDGRLLATVSMGVRAVCIWEVENAYPLWLLQDPVGKIYQVQFSPDSKIVYTDSDKRATWLAWDLVSGESAEVEYPSGTFAAPPESQAACPCGTRGGPYETRIYLKKTGEVVAWFPAEMYGVLSEAPSGRIWAGSASSHLFLLKLEGIIADGATALHSVSSTCR